MAPKELGVRSLCHSNSFGFILLLGGSSPLLAAVFSSLISFVFLSFCFWFALYFLLTDRVLFFNAILVSSVIAYFSIEAEEVRSLCM